MRSTTVLAVKLSRTCRRTAGLTGHTNMELTPAGLARRGPPRSPLHIPIVVIHQSMTTFFFFRMARMTDCTRTPSNIFRSGIFMIGARLTHPHFHQQHLPKLEQTPRSTPCTCDMVAAKHTHGDPVEHAPISAHETLQAAGKEA